MIHDLDSTMKALFKRELPQVRRGNANYGGHQLRPARRSVSAAGVSLPAIDLFLYDVRENHDLRSNEWWKRREAAAQRSAGCPPVRIDCSYLITAWPRKAH